jgi:hypothetical protein
MEVNKCKYLGWREESMLTRVSKPSLLCWLVRERAMVTFFILGC